MYSFYMYIGSFSVLESFTFRCDLILITQVVCTFHIVSCHLQQLLDAMKHYLKQISGDVPTLNTFVKISVLLWQMDC